MSEACDRFWEKIKNNKLNWSIKDKDKYQINYATIPYAYLAFIRTKTLIPGVNPCLESEVFIFENYSQMEEFFEKLTGDKDDW